MLQTRVYFRQKAAQTCAGISACLAGAAPWGSVGLVGGGPILVSLAELQILTPSYVGQAGAIHASLPDFFRIAGLLKNRRGFAQPGIAVGIFLHNRQVEGFVPPSRKSKKQGWARCEQRNSSRQLHFVRALRPAAKQPANKRFTARGQACSALSSSMAIRSSGRSPGLRPTYFTARPARATADPRTALTFQDNRPFPGPIRNAQRAAVGQPACGGVLRLQHLQPKDTSCSTRS